MIFGLDKMAKQDWRKTMHNGWTNDKNLNKIRIKYEDGGSYAMYLYDKNWKVIKIKNFPFHKSHNRLKETIKFMIKN